MVGTLGNQDHNVKGTFLLLRKKDKNLSYTLNITFDKEKKKWRGIKFRKLPKKNIFDTALKYGNVISSQTRDEMREKSMPIISKLIHYDIDKSSIQEGSSVAKL